jgi:hypothetical protein
LFVPSRTGGKLSKAHGGASSAESKNHASPSDHAANGLMMLIGVSRGGFSIVAGLFFGRIQIRGHTPAIAGIAAQPLPYGRQELRVPMLRMTCDIATYGGRPFAAWRDLLGCSLLR